MVADGHTSVCGEKAGGMKAKRVMATFAAISFGLLGITSLGAEPAGAATYSVTFSGVVICSSSAWGVQGVWVQNADGTDGWARWWSFPGKANAAKYSITVSASRPDPTIRLDVGCGGERGAWRKTLRTPDFRTRNTYTENRRCDVAAANGSRVCLPSPRGQSLTYNYYGAGRIGYGYCTDGVVRKWQAYTRYWPYFSGNAGQMDDNPRGHYVSSVAMGASIVVFDTNANPGHVGWVTKVYKNAAGGVVFDYVDMNGGTGGSAANDWRTNEWNEFHNNTGRAWDPSRQRFILAPT
jgi:hypothetical protein